MAPPGEHRTGVWSAAPPPMGYSAFGEMKCGPTHSKVTKAAIRLKNIGLSPLGYSYFLIKDCWMAKDRDTSGNLRPTDKLSEGIDSIASHLRELGFKVGLGISPGPKTCNGFPGSFGNENIDAQKIASWGIDMVKNGGCSDLDCGYSLESSSPKCTAKAKRSSVKRYKKMWEALNKTGRPLLHMVDGAQPWYAPVGNQIGHAWNIAASITDFASLYQAVRVMEQLLDFHGVFGLVDLGYLVGSNANLTFMQSRAQFTLWSILSVPLFFEVSITHLSAFDFETFSNKGAIAINQDSRAGPPMLIYSNCPKYPTLMLSKLPDGAPNFEIQNLTAYLDVLCGRRSSLTECTNCMDGKGSHSCNDECFWIKSSQTCAPLPHPHTPDTQSLQEMSNPWSVKRFSEADLRHCQMVWARDFGNSEFAVAAVNFDPTKDASLDVQLSKFGVAPDTKMVVDDVWYMGAVSNPHIVSDVLRLHLPPDGGHALLKLRVPTRGDLVATTAENAWISLTAKERLENVLQRVGSRANAKQVNSDIPESLMEDPELGDTLHPAGSVALKVVLVIVAIVGFAFWSGFCCARDLQPDKRK